MLEGGHPASTMLSPRPRPASLPQPAPKAFLRSFPALCLSCHHQPQGDRPDHASLLSKSEAALEALSCHRGAAGCSHGRGGRWDLGTPLFPIPPIVPQERHGETLVPREAR